jgi:hypothetical protein
MRRYATGGLFGIGIWMAAIASAEAQTTITPIGPLTIYCTDSQTIYSANITSSYNAFRIDFWCFQRTSPTSRTLRNFQWKIVNKTVPTYTYYRGITGMQNWGMTTDHDIEFELKVSITGDSGSPYWNYYYLDVTGPCTKLDAEDRRRPPALYAALAERKGWA